MKLFVFCIYVIAVLYLIFCLVIRADEFFIKKYQDNSYAITSSRIMLVGMSFLVLGIALEIFVKVNIF